MNKDNIYKAFSNATRLMLLRCLYKPKSVTEMLEHCSLTQSALSQHLKVLRDAGVVKTRKKGKIIEYSISNNKVVQITNMLLNYK